MNNTYEETINELKRQYQEVERRRIEENKQKDIALIAIAQLLDDDTALKCALLYPTFEDSIGREVTQGFKFTHDGKLYKVIQPDLTIQAQHVPGTGTESLYAVIDEKHAGTVEDPIPYDGNMALEKDKYYVQDTVVYVCIRDTENAVFNSLTELVGTYVQVI